MGGVFFLVVLAFAFGNACLLVSAEHRSYSHMKSGNRRLLEEDAPSCEQFKCMCILDFDETLRVVKDVDGKDHRNEDTPAKDAKEVISECKKLGCGIAIASANSNREKLTTVLPRIDGNTFTEEFFNSPLFQYGYNDKEIELRNILSCTNVAPNCVAFFDDMEHNRVYAHRAGVHFEKVDGAEGVTMENFQNAMETLVDWDCSNVNCD